MYAPNRVVRRQPKVLLGYVLGPQVGLDDELIVGADLGDNVGQEQHDGERDRGRRDDERGCDEHLVQAPARVHVRYEAVHGLCYAGAALCAAFRPLSPPPHAPSASALSCPSRVKTPPSPPPPFLGNISS